MFSESLRTRADLTQDVATAGGREARRARRRRARVGFPNSPAIEEKQMKLVNTLCFVKAYAAITHIRSGVINGSDC
jgi:hypothetical protein